MSKALLRGVFKSMVKNARVRGLPVEITLGDVEALWDVSGGRCAVSGVPFDFERIAASRRRPFAASIDRIDCAKGYTRENSRLVCVAVNYAMGDWGFDVLNVIAHGITKMPSRAGVCRPLPERRQRGTSVRRKNGRLYYEVQLTDAEGKRRFLGTFASEGEAHEHWKAALAVVIEGGDLEPFLPKRSNRHAHQALLAPGLGSVSP